MLLQSLNTSREVASDSLSMNLYVFAYLCNMGYKQGRDLTENCETAGYGFSRGKTAVSTVQAKGRLYVQLIKFWVRQKTRA